MNKKVAIIGCGWLGLPLAESLIKNDYEVNGSTTSKGKITDLKKVGVNPFLISLSEDKVTGDIDGFLRDVSIVIVNVPPKLRSVKKENYVRKMQLLKGAISDSVVQKVIFVSSSSVYGDIEGEVTEETEPLPSTESGRQLLLSEEVFRTNNEFQTTVIRFGGLIGDGRHPINMLSGREGLLNGHHPINLIHLNDCIGIIQAIIENNWWNETFNGVYPYHPKKKDYYILEAKKRGLQVPDYKEDNLKKGKIVRPNRLISVKNHTFTTTL